MTYFIAYDISNPKRLRGVAKILENYGWRVQYSFFECEMDSKVFENLKHDLLSVINIKEDSLHFYPICEDCLKKTSSIGHGDIYIPRSYEIL
ncbi:MAG: CRISPR-associated endonuclease Cas2 [Treponema sp. CETP13]|nr:MAG: CRISPR-associated endonuclease Cas2 [Treponema sp. CETP13]